MDIGGNDFVQLGVNFSFDGFPLNKTEPNVVQQAVTLMNSWEYLKHTYDPYVNDVTSST